MNNTYLFVTNIFFNSPHFKICKTLKTEPKIKCGKVENFTRYFFKIYYIINQVGQKEVWVINDAK